MEDFEDIQEIFKMKKMNNIKFIVNIIGLLGALGGGWYKLESRVTSLEEEIEKQGQIKNIQAEIELMKRDQELEELRFKFKLDSLQRS